MSLRNLNRARGILFVPPSARTSQTPIRSADVSKMKTVAALKVGLSFDDQRALFPERETTLATLLERARSHDDALELAVYRALVALGAV
jgi:hypothetical protein